MKGNAQQQALQAIVCQLVELNYSLALLANGGAVDHNAARAEIAEAQKVLDKLQEVCGRLATKMVQSRIAHLHN